MQAELDLRFEAAPAAGHVPSPGDYAVTLRAGEAGAHHDHRPHVRVGCDLPLVDHPGPHVAVGVVHLVAGRLDPGVRQPVQCIGRMHLGFAQVAPGACNTLVEQPPVVLPEPVPRSLVEDVDEAGIAEVEVEA